MLLLLKAVFGAIYHLLAIAVKIVYNILKLLRVRLLAFYLVVWGFVRLFYGRLPELAVTWFYVGLALCLLVTLLAWCYALHARRKRALASRARKEENAKEENERKEGKEAPAEQSAPSQRQDGEEGAVPPAYPRYFETGQEGYLFAEYEDRFELYVRDGEVYRHVRTDKKEGNA